MDTDEDCPQITQIKQITQMHTDENYQKVTNIKSA